MADGDASALFLSIALWGNLCLCTNRAGLERFGLVHVHKKHVFNLGVMFVHGCTYHNFRGISADVTCGTAVS